MNQIGPNQDADRPRLVAFGGGKGGAGRSTLCAEVARSIARQGQRVLCVDADFACPTLNTLLKVEEPTFSFDETTPALGEDGAHVADFIEQTGTENIWLTSLASARRFPYVRPGLRPEVLVGQMHALDFDWILLDLPAGLDPLPVNLFVLSDLPIVVGTPEPAAVRTTTQFLRSALFQAIGYHPEAPDRHEAVLETLNNQSLDMTVDSLLQDAPPEIHRIFETTADRLETYVVVNLVREGAEQDLGYVLCHAWKEELGLFPRSLPHVEYEDRRWFYHRRTTGTNTVRGDEKLSRDIEHVARAIMDISIVDGRFPRPIPRGDEEALHPALKLGISPDTGRNEVRQHCRRLWEGFGRESAVGLVFEDEERRAHITEELETLYRQVLQLPTESFKSVSLGGSSGSSPDQSGSLSEAGASPTATPSSSNQPDDRESSTSRDRARQTAADNDTASDQAASSQSSDDTATADATSGADAEHDEAVDTSHASIPDVAASRSPGLLVEKLRRRAGISLHDLSMQTQIGIKYLTAIEDVELDVLPRQVYLRNYLREIARAFEVDPDGLVKKYFELLDEE